MESRDLGLYDMFPPTNVNIVLALNHTALTKNGGSDSFLSRSFISATLSTEMEKYIIHTYTLHNVIDPAPTSRFNRIDHYELSHIYQAMW